MHYRVKIIEERTGNAPQVHNTTKDVEASTSFAAMRKALAVYEEQTSGPVPPNYIVRAKPLP